MNDSHLKKERPKLSDVCVYGGKQNDAFVGIRYEDGALKVFFPFGYSKPALKSEKEYRKDILNLVSVLSSFEKESLFAKDNFLNREDVSFPIHAYIHVFNYFLNNGYYIENEPVYRCAKSGKINWAKTIKCMRPQMAGDHLGESAVYLHFVTKKSAHNENELITQIHKYCVYEAFEKIGVLFGYPQPDPPKIPFNASTFAAIIQSKMARTFHEKHLLLFQNMLDMIRFVGKKKDDRRISYGTYHFEYIWEGLIDRVFGIADKEQYFPHCRWKIKGHKDATFDWRNEKRNALRPDTIMVANVPGIFILDAKYYQYGDDGVNKSNSRNPRTLPGSGSILKQIAYAEFIESKIFPSLSKGNLYNAFILPYAAKDGQNTETNYRLENFGYAECEWKTENARSYEKIHGILLDVRSIMQRHPKSSKNDRAELARIITDK